MTSQCCGDDDAMDDQITLVKSAFPDVIADVAWRASTRQMTIVTSQGTEVSFRLDEHLAPVGDVTIARCKRRNVVDLKERLHRVLMTSSTAAVDLFEVARLLAAGDVSAPAPVVTSSRWVSLFRVEHMRDRGRYVKQLRKWVKQLQVDVCDVIRVVTSSPAVLLLVCGRDEAVCGELLRRIRTTKGIDVDSRGRGCKEKLLDVLHQGPMMSSAVAVDGRGLVESSFEDLDELESYLSGLGLRYLFDDFIK